MSTILQVSGISLISAGAYLAWPPLGITLFGIGILLFGLAMERGNDAE
jgi:hypothetical protein